MKRTIIAIIQVASLLLFFSAQADEEDFPWVLFIPVITSGTADQEISCESIAGCYSGLFVDTCSGSSVEGRINISVRKDCSFVSITDSGIQASGSITDQNQSIYTGNGQTDANGCGAFTISINHTGDSFSGNWEYKNGRHGSITNAASGVCKSANRLATEMLAGSWRFTYSVGSSTYTDSYQFNLGSVEELSSYPGAFVIYGQDQFGDPVSGGYSPDIQSFEIVDPSIITNWFDYYQFYPVINGQVSGCHFLITDGYMYSCDVTSGKRLSY